MRATFVVPGLLVLGMTVVSAADHWPHFRPNAGVVADDPMLPDTWGTKENVAWKVAVPGLGWGSPIVWGEHIFVTSVIGDDIRTVSSLWRIARIGPLASARSAAESHHNSATEVYNK